MRHSSTLAGYLALRFLLWMAAAAGLAATLALTADMLELMRRAAARPEMTFDMVLATALLRMPWQVTRILPLCVLFGALFAFWDLTRSRELVVVRASGVSVWQFLAPALVLAAAIGIAASAVFGPVASALRERADRIEASRLPAGADAAAVDAAGIWLAEAGPDGRIVVNAATAREQTGGGTLTGVTLFHFDARGGLVRRIDAATARLADGTLTLEDALSTAGDGTAARHAAIALPTGLTMARIAAGGRPPADLSIWELPTALAEQTRAGLSTAPYRVHLHERLALPLLLCGLVLVAAAVSLRPGRRRHPVALAAMGAAAGIALLAASDFAAALGAAGRLPAILAAWAPAAVCIAAGAGVLLRFEDG